MNFTSIEYLGFLLFIVTLFYGIIPKYRLRLLVLAGYVFYSFLSWKYCFLLLIMSLLTYLLGFWVSKNRKENWVISTSIFLILLPLLFFKYYNFFLIEILSSGNSNFIHSYAFPIGISFFSFQMVSYLVDIRRGYLLPEPSLGKVLLHHAFFPVLLSGPIERSRKLMSQFDFQLNFDYKNVRNGLFQILWGIFKKIVIANNLAFYVNTIYKNIEKSNGIEVYMAMIFFVFQIVIDFSAYNDIAMGSAKVFGIKITKNIHDRAYASTSRTQLWQRWHVSLTSWLRDYVFFPLSKFSKKTYCNITNMFFC